MGRGKSTVIRHLWNELSNNKEISLASVLTPNFPSDFAMLKAICSEYGDAPKRVMLAQESAFKDFLANFDAEGKTAVILIDEAQRLTGKQLELIRVMLNLEMPKYKTRANRSRRTTRIEVQTARGIEKSFTVADFRAIKSRLKVGLGC